MVVAVDGDSRPTRSAVSAECERDAVAVAVQITVHVQIAVDNRSAAFDDRLILRAS